MYTLILLEALGSASFHMKSGSGATPLSTTNSAAVNDDPVIAVLVLPSLFAMPSS
jgi:hypothetical protein